jgi:hypothetical protein
MEEDEKANPRPLRVPMSAALHEKLEELREGLNVRRAPHVVRLAIETLHQLQLLLSQHPKKKLALVDPEDGTFVELLLPGLHRRFPVVLSGKQKLGDANGK